jgi:hypothetical protein
MAESAELDEAEVDREDGGSRDQPAHDPGGCPFPGRTRR